MSQYKTITELQEHIKSICNQFIHDPADSDFQTGYLLAYLDLACVLGLEHDKHIIDAAKANSDSIKHPFKRH